MKPLQQRPSREAPKQAFFDLKQLGTRWHCHHMTAYRRLLRLGVRPVKLSGRSVLFRTSDIERIEFGCIT
jgi:hypothetical protein